MEAAVALPMPPIDDTEMWTEGRSCYWGWGKSWSKTEGGLGFQSSDVSWLGAG